MYWTYLVRRPIVPGEATAPRRRENRWIQA
jgi:hypothetical protein